jgi:hypothetical protein
MAFAMGEVLTTYQHIQMSNQLQSFLLHNYTTIGIEAAAFGPTGTI